MIRRAGTQSFTLMFGGLIIPVVVGGVIAAHFARVGLGEIVGRPVPNEVFIFFAALFPFLGIRILDRVLIGLSLRFRRRDAGGNPLEPPIRHRFWFIPLPVWSYLWVAFVVGFTAWGAVNPQTEEDKQRAQEFLDRWIEKRRSAREGGLVDP